MIHTSNIMADLVHKQMANHVILPRSALDLAAIVDSKEEKLPKIQAAQFGFLCLSRNIICFCYFVLLRKSKQKMQSSFRRGLPNSRLQI